MGYAELGRNVTDRARNAKRAAEEVRSYARDLIVALSTEFASEDAQAFGVKLVHSEDGQSVQISSPFGEARAKFTMFLNEFGVYGRYSFERKLTDYQDRDIWKEVYFLDVREGGRILSELGDEESARFNVTQPRRDQYFTLALAITAALGRNPSDEN